MNHLVTLEHPGNPDAAQNLCEREDGVVVDSLTGEELTREQVEGALEVCKQNVRTLQNYLDRTCGVHPVLVRLKDEGFEEPDADSGWSFADEPEFVLQVPHRRSLSVTCRYEHFDDRGGQFEQEGEFGVVDGKFGIYYVGPDGGPTLDEEEVEPVDADNFEACQNLLTEYFHTDGPG